MLLYSLLAVTEEATEVVKWISILAIALFIGVLFAVNRKDKTKIDTKRIAFGGVCVALSFTLAVIKFKPIQYGGSITLASFVPVLIYAYFYGVKDGLIVGLIHGLLNFIESPYILTPATFLLDYILPFASIGAMGFFGKLSNKMKGATPLILGCVCVFLLRFTFHLLSGVIFFLNDAIWVEFPAWAVSNAFIYSFIYQCVYVPADCLIACAVLYALYKSDVLTKLQKMMK